MLDLFSNFSTKKKSFFSENHAKNPQEEPPKIVAVDLQAMVIKYNNNNNERLYLFYVGGDDINVLVCIFIGTIGRRSSTSR